MSCTGRSSTRCNDHAMTPPRGGELYFHPLIAGVVLIWGGLAAVMAWALLLAR